MAEGNQIQELVGNAHDVHRNTGALDLTLPTGAKCSGKWSSVVPQFSTITSTSLLGTYGSIVGLSTTTGSVLGVNRGEAIAVCSDGTRIEMEFLTGSGTANGVGIARDTNGNIYKMLF
ncbi:MAG: hypothetical protein ACFB03_12785 [Paracoccaceae bacterium]